MTKPTYHHGNLREALVAVAVDLIASEGATDLTLARAARQAGVTPAAVYRHFKGRDDLIAEIARQGHDRLDLLTAPAARAPDPVQAVLAYGQATLDFARRFPGHRAAMQTAHPHPDHMPALAAAVSRSTAILGDLARRLCTGAHSPPPDLVAAHIAALCRGMAETHPQEDEPLRTGLRLYLEGLRACTPPD